MKERPIIFSTEMVRAILDEIKTQTRRVVKSQKYGLASQLALKCRYGIIGDRLWVRETFVIETTRGYSSDVEEPTDRPLKVIENDEDGRYLLIPHYRATEPEPGIVPEDRDDLRDDHTAWKPSIYLPRWASRILLEIINIRGERLQDISEEDAEAEGCEEDLCDCNIPDCGNHKDAKEVFSELWDSINGKKCSWKSNPWVWVIEFKRI